MAGSFVPGDAAATAINILAQASLLRLGFASYLVEMACLIAATALFYDLLRPVSRSVSLLAAFFSLLGIAIKTLSRFLAPPLAARAYPYVVTIALLGTAAQIVWLLVYGVNE